jgi:hypothetical protein
MTDYNKKRDAALVAWQSAAVIRYMLADGPAGWHKLAKRAEIELRAVYEGLRDWEENIDP